MATIQNLRRGILLPKICSSSSPFNFSSSRSQFINFITNNANFLSSIFPILFIFYFIIYFSFINNKASKTVVFLLLARAVIFFFIFFIIIFLKRLKVQLPISSPPSHFNTGEIHTSEPRSSPSGSCSSSTSSFPSSASEPEPERDLERCHRTRLK